MVYKTSKNRQKVKTQPIQRYDVVCVTMQRNDLKAKMLTRPTLNATIMPLNGYDPRNGLPVMQPK